MRSWTIRLAGLAAIAAACGAGAASADTLVHFTYTMGTPATTMDVYEDIYASPGVTSTNFLTYVNSNAYTNAFVSHSVPGSVLQGAFKFGSPADVSGNPNIQYVPTGSPIPLQYGLPNQYGTLAMAWTGSDPNSATSQFFINTADNSAALAPNGPDHPGYAVFGSVLNAASMNNVLTIAGVQTYDASGQFATPNANFTDLPLTSPTWQSSSFVTITSATIMGEMGDINHDGVVNLDDILAFDDAYLMPHPNLVPNSYADWQYGDFNMDGTVDATDAAILFGAYAADSGASPNVVAGLLAGLPATVPEPGTLAVLGVGAAMLLRRRRS